jgi:hypothetical protein
VDGGVVPRRDVFGSRRWGRVSPGRSSLLGWRGASLRCGSRSGNSVHGHLWARRILCPSFACHKLQPRRAAIIFNATRVAANLLPARPLVARGLESRGHGFPGSDGGRRLGSRINRKGRPAKRASHDRVNRGRGGKVRMTSKEAGSSPGYGDSSPFGHLLRLRTAQVPRCRLRFPALLSRLGGGRLGPSLGVGWIVSSLFAVYWL